MEMSNYDEMFRTPEISNPLDMISNSGESMPISFSKCESYNEVDFLIKSEENLSNTNEINENSEIIFTTKFQMKNFAVIKNHFNTLFKISYPEEFFEKILNKTYHTIVGITKNFKDLICFAVLNIENNNKIAEILSFGVIKEFQGKKFGTKLLNKIIEEMKILGIKNISLIVQVTNGIAINLYKNFGFETVKEDSNYYHILEGENRKAFYMRKSIVQEQFWIFKVFRNIEGLSLYFSLT